ncbi:ATP-binding protein [Massilia agilis]|uniref:ATP-binding protein n=1 Tax=Massilia agilis TaxID=1811226 RepID=A0ABT2DEA7_9BURK|nr:ATP-binding protein [Massilia agilis]MCS0809179.1 ATP-binding protein [Massilia agilis]
MMNALSAAAELHGARAAPPPAAPEFADILPRQAKTVLDTGLPPRLVTELVVKVLHGSGKTPLPALSARLKLSVNVLREILNQLMAEQQVEVAWTGDSDIDVQYQLTAPGQRAAADYLAQSRYAGPAPVPLASYREVVERQSLRRPGAPRPERAQLAAALAEHGFDPALRDVLGAALHSRRALLLYGPSGAGKTLLAHQLARLQHGAVALPYALLVERQIIQFYDPLLHQPAPPLPRQQEERRSWDARWAICQRPLVHVGAALAADMLDLREDAASGVLRAPPHVLANNGMLVVDDLGRQRLPLADLLGRWLGALDQGWDALALPGGHSETVPFDATVVFATSLAPDALLDESFLRRIGYKVGLGPLPEAAYRALLRRACRQAGIEPDEDAASRLLALHAASGRPLLPAYPHELLGRISDFASFAGATPRLSAAAVEQAWNSMFAACAAPTTSGEPS